MEEIFMKKFLLVIFVPIGIIIGTPVLLLAIMYDGSGDVNMPTHLYSEDADYQKMLYQELDDSLNDVENSLTDDMIFNVSEDIINTAIFETITKGEDAINPNYMPNDNCAETSTEEECNYILYEPFEINADSNIEGKLVGVWVEFEDIENGDERVNEGKLIVNVYLELSASDGIAYKTLVQLSFIVTDDSEQDQYKFAFDKIKAGNLPIPRTLITTILDAAGIDLNSELDTEGSIGVFEQADMSYTVLKQELIDSINSNDDGTELTPEEILTQEVLNVIFSKYVLFDVDDDEISLSVAVSLLKSEDIIDIPNYLYDLHFMENVDGVDVIGEFDPDAFDPEAYLTDSFAEYIFNSALTGNSEFYINESVVNKLIYSGAEGFADMTKIQEYEDADGVLHQIEIGLKALWFEFEEGEAGAEVYVKAFFKVAGINSALEIKTVNVSADPTELVFDFNRITIGKDFDEADGDYTVFEQTDAFKEVLANMDSLEFVEFNDLGQLIISANSLSKLLQDGKENSNDPTFSITEIGVVEGAIFLKVVPDDQGLQDILDALSTTLNEAIGTGELADGLADALDLTDPNQNAIYEDVLDLQTALTDPEVDVNPDDITDMFTTFELLDEVAQEAFLNTFEETIDPSDFSEFEDLLTGGSGTTTP
jgi:hypothetical protein